MSASSVTVLSSKALTLRLLDPHSKSRPPLPAPCERDADAWPVLTILGSSTLVNTLNAWAAAIGQPAFVTSTCAEITGAPARTFLEWATDHAAELRAQTRRGVG